MIANLLAKRPHLQPPGPSDVKQCELHNKGRKTVPPECKEITCPKSPDEVLQRAKEEKRKKASAKKAKAEGENTEENK